MTPSELHLHHMWRETNLNARSSAAGMTAYHEGIDAQLEGLSQMYQSAKLSRDFVIRVLQQLKDAATAASNREFQRLREEYERNPLQGADQK